MSDTEINGNVCQKLTSTSMEDLSEYTDADESISAPTEILAEFLSAIMTKDYENALKYCQLILSYEPENSTAKEFYPLIVDKLKFIQTEGETDDSLSESSESYNSTSSSSSESEAYVKQKKHLDSDGTTASYSSLEDDEPTAANNEKSNFRISSKDITNGNATERVTTNISIPVTTSFKQSVKETEKSEKREKKVEEEKNKEEDCKNLLIHSTPTTTLKRDNNATLCRTQTYTKITNNMKKPLKTCALKKVAPTKSLGCPKKTNLNLNLSFSKKKAINAKVKDAPKTNRQASAAIGKHQ